MPVHGTIASSTAMIANTIISSRIARGVTGIELSVIAVMSGRPSGQSRWFYQEHQHHQDEYHGVGSLGIKVLRQAFDHPERETGDDRSHDRAHAADHHYREHPHHEAGPHQPPHPIDRP